MIKEQQREKSSLFPLCVIFLGEFLVKNFSLFAWKSYFVLGNLKKTVDIMILI